MRLPHRTPHESIPYAEQPRLFGKAARRTTVVRIGFGVGLLAAAALGVGIARGGGVTEAAYLSSGGTNVVVMDFSYSISGGEYRLIVNALRKIVAAGSPVGLIGFSDVAYQMLPPGTPARELEPVAKLFVPTLRGGNIVFPPSPWAPLQGGTRISTGLFLADSALRHAHATKGSVVLISDLETSSDDAPSVVDAVSALRRDGYSLHLVGLGPTPPSLHFFESLAGKRAFVDPQQLAAPVGKEPSSTSVLSGQTQWAFLGVATLLALLLAGNERWCRALDLSGLRGRS